MRNRLSNSFSFGILGFSLVVIYLLLGHSLKKVSLPGGTDIVFYEKDSSPPSNKNPDKSDDDLKNTFDYIECLNRQGSGCFMSP